MCRLNEAFISLFISTLTMSLTETGTGSGIGVMFTKVSDKASRASTVPVDSYTHTRLHVTADNGYLTEPLNVN